MRYFMEESVLIFVIASVSLSASILPHSSFGRVSKKSILRHFEESSLAASGGRSDSPCPVQLPVLRHSGGVTNSRTLFEHSLHENFTHSTSSRSAVHLHPPFFPSRSTVLLERALASLSPAPSLNYKKMQN